MCVYVITEKSPESVLAVTLFIQVARALQTSLLMTLGALLSDFEYLLKVLTQTINEDQQL